MASNLGPALRDAAYDDLKLMIMDDQRINLPDWAVTVRREGGRGGEGGAGCGRSGQ